MFNVRKERKISSQYRACQEFEEAHMMYMEKIPSEVEDELSKDKVWVKSYKV